MPVEIVVVPCRSDNYAYLLRDAGSGRVAVVDAPDAAAIEAALDRRGWGLDAVLITHHHDDHIAGVDRLRERYRAMAVGAAADRHRLPRLDREVVEGDDGGAGVLEARVLEAPGHTRGHVAYHVPAAGALFSADSLMVMGCGRLFEGTPAEMWATLGKLSGLPPETRLFSGHEYTEANLAFARSLEPDSPALASRAEAVARALAEHGHSMGPTLSVERGTNPFLRAKDPVLKSRLGMDGAPDVEVFAEIRRRKDAF